MHGGVGGGSREASPYPDYLAGLGLDNGWLVIFDRRAGQPPIRERMSSTEMTSPQGRWITVIRA